MRQCFLHVGTHKTGTTSIQNQLRALADSGVATPFLYPAAGSEVGSSAHHQLAFALRDDPVREGADAVVSSVVEWVSGTDKDVVFSSEEFVNALYFSPKRFTSFVQRIRPGFDRVVVIVYLRNQEAYIVSNYLERLKYGFALDFERYTVDHLEGCVRDEIDIDYLDLLARIEDCTCDEAVICNYDVAAAGNLIDQFWAVLGQPRLFSGTSERVNNRQPLPELLKLFLQNHIGREATRFEREAIMRFHDACLPPGVLRASYALSALIRRRYALSNKAINARYGTKLPTELGNPANVGDMCMDRLFTATLPSLLQSFAAYPERLHATDIALAEAQRLAIERYRDIKVLEQRLNDT